MKKLSLLLSVFVIVGTIGCRKKKDEKPSVEEQLEDGVVEGKSVPVDGGVINRTVNIEGGEVKLSGDTEVTSDINMKEDGGELEISDDVVVNKINMDNGVVKLTGSPTINTDFNVNAGTVYIGDGMSTIEDTVTLKVNMNLSDSLFVLGGVFIVEADFNMHENAFVTVEDGAKLVVKNHFNKDGELYGLRNIEKNVYNNNGGIEQESPWVAQD